MNQPAQKGEERRQFQRVSLEARISFESENNFYTGFTGDLSEGGIFVSTYDLQPIGTEIELEFMLPEGPVVKIVGIVKWLKEPQGTHEDISPGMGIEFTNVSPEHQAAIQRFISKRAPIFYE